MADNRMSDVGHSTDIRHPTSAFASRPAVPQGVQLTVTEPTIPLVKLVEWTVQRYRYVPADTKART